MGQIRAVSFHIEQSHVPIVSGQIRAVSFHIEQSPCSHCVGLDQGSVISYWTVPMFPLCRVISGQYHFILNSPHVPNVLGQIRVVSFHIEQSPCSHCVGSDRGSVISYWTVPMFPLCRVRSGQYYFILKSLHVPNVLRQIRTDLTQNYQQPLRQSVMTWNI